MKKLIVTDSRKTTGIGSLPHHNVDAALAYSFNFDIPFLPQIPIRNPWEYMIAQAIEGLPGLLLENDGSVTLSAEIWKGQSHLLDKRLENAFSRQAHQAFDAFEPSGATSSCWQPFLWELEERGCKIAKIQIAGPLTCQWALKLKDGTSLDRLPELSTQIFRLILARSLAMVDRLVAEQIQPILYLDEPGLFALSLSNPKHLLCLQELKLMIQSLKKAGAIVGLHCCGNTNWQAILHLGIDILSIDTALSLESAISAQESHSSEGSLESFVKSGGILSLGIIPSARTSILRTLNSADLVKQLRQTFEQNWGSQPSLIQKTLNEALYTPACGLALQSTSDAEIILDLLMKVRGSLV